MKEQELITLSQLYKVTIVILQFSSSPKQIYPVAKVEAKYEPIVFTRTAGRK